MDNADDILANPFAHAFKIMNDLRAEVDQLRQKVLEEQEQREREVSDLKLDLKRLEGVLTAEQEERKSTDSKLGGMQAAESQQRKSELEKQSSEKKSEIAKLTGSLEDLATKSNNVEKDLAARLSAEVMERKADSECVVRELTTIKKFTDTWSVEQGQTPKCVVDLADDVRKIAGHLFFMNNTWKGVQYEGLTCLESLENNQEDPRAKAAEEESKTVPNPSTSGRGGIITSQALNSRKVA